MLFRSSSSARPSRGAKPRGADDRKLPQRQPHQAGSRGGREIKVGAPREEPVTQAMTIETRRVPGGHRPAQCPYFPFGAKGASIGQGIGQRLPFRCNETKTSKVAGRRSPWSPGRRHHQYFWQPKTTFGQCRCKNRRISGRGSRTVRLGRMVTGDKGQIGRAHV